MSLTEYKFEALTLEPTCSLY